MLYTSNLYNVICQLYLNFKNHCLKKVDTFFKLSSLNFFLVHSEMTNH